MFCGDVELGKFKQCLQAATAGRAKRPVTLDRDGWTYGNPLSVNVYGRPRVSKHFLIFVERKERSSSYVYPAS